MNINRHNYEEYFLLYADNELSAAEMNMVEVFLAANPDLQEEMKMLQQAIIQPEKIEFYNKEYLLKPAPLEADIQEQLLLLLDNELPANQKRYVQSLSKYDELVKKEWELLQQTKLSAADTIIFEDKASLYKKEGGRVIAFRWWRMAAAAILIGFGLWGTVSYFKYSNKNLSAEETSAGMRPVEPVVKPVEVTSPIQDLRIATAKEQESTSAATKQNTNNNTRPVKRPIPGKKIIPEIIPQKDNNSIVQQNNNNDLPKPVLDNLNNYPGNKTTTANVSPQQKDNKEPGSIDPAEDKATAATSYAVNTVLTNTDSKKSYASFEDEEEEDKPKKSRVGGFFKKVKRVLERKTKINAGDDNTIKIANMSFVMH